MAQEVLTAELASTPRIGRSSPPARKGIMNCQKVGILYFKKLHQLPYTAYTETANIPILNEFLALLASCSSPSGDKNGDFEFKVAAIVRAGSKHRNIVAIRRNFPR